MKIGIFYPTNLPFSVCNYIENVVRELEQFGIDTVFIVETELLPEEVDLYWDPRAMGGATPYEKLLSTKKPLVVTVHGVRPFTLPAREYYSSLKSAIIGKLYNLKNIYQWRRFRHYCAAIITVSSYAKGEIQKYLGLDGEKMFPIHHGVDLKTFKPNNENNSHQTYFLHVSQYQPAKNVDRIIEAYARLPRNKPQLVAVVSGYSKRESLPSGVKLIRTPVSQKELVSLYQKATAFVFPSLHEGFGMPILEAMACGCPVITSNVTACPEIAGDAALLVNPRSVDEIAEAMKLLLEDEHLRQELREKGLARAQQFTWRKSAEKHLEVFEKVLQEMQK